MSILDSVGDFLSSPKLNTIVNQAMDVYGSVKGTNVPAQTTVATPIPQNTAVSNTSLTAGMSTNTKYILVGVAFIGLILILRR